jgi:hypothetical protein
MKYLKNTSKIVPIVESSEKPVKKDIKSNTILPTFFIYQYKNESLNKINNHPIPKDNLDSFLGRMTRDI